MDGAREADQYRWGMLLFLIFSVTLLGWNLGGARTLTHHEAIVGSTAREMVETGDWLVPRIAGKPWLEKPPLAQWLVALLGWLTGQWNEFWSRLPSVLLGLTGLWLLTDLACRTLGWRLGLLTGLAQASTLYFLTYARLAEVDIHLWTTIVACMWAFAIHWVDPKPPTRWYHHPLVFFLLLGLTQLTKGPLFGAALASAPCLAYLASQPNRQALLWIFNPLGWGGMLLVAGIWPLLVLLQYPETADLWYWHVLGRVTGENQVNPKPIWYYCTTLPWQLLPWTLTVLPALPASGKRAWQEPRSIDRLLWLWFLTQFTILSLARCKHHHYLIHALPPFAFWAAQGIPIWRSWLAELWRRPMLLAGLVLLAALPGVGACVFLVNQLGPSLRLEVPLVLGGLLFSLVLLCWSCTLPNLRAMVLVLFASYWLGSAYLHSFWLSRTDNYDETVSLIQRFGRQVPPETPLGVFGGYAFHPAFYADRPVRPLETPEEIEAFLKENQVCYVFASPQFENTLRTWGQLDRLDETPNLGSNRLARRPLMAIYRIEPADQGTGQ